jgi:putative membrane protein
MSNNVSMRRLGRYHMALLLIFLAAWTWAAIKPAYRADWLLENYLVFISIPLIVGLAFYFRLSRISYTLITIFMVLHVIGSHYTYAEVPFGFTLQRWFGSDRNMYDRLVHFCFGLLIAYPVREVFMRLSRARGFWSYYLPVELTLAFSAIYELIEWAAAVVVSPQAGLAFLGAQGDIWDAQKDMAMAGLGSLVGMTVTFLLALLIEADTWLVFKESFRVPPGDHPIGDEQLASWIRRRLGRNKALEAE